MKNQVAGFNRFHECDGNESHPRFVAPTLNQGRDLYRVNFEVNNLKPFACLAFPHTTYVKTLRKQPIFGDELVTSSLLFPWEKRTVFARPTCAIADCGSYLVRSIVKGKSGRTAGVGEPKTGESLIIPGLKMGGSSPPSSAAGPELKNVV